MESERPDSIRNPSTEHLGDGHVNAPVVFQCRQCNEIVGDTMDFVCSDEVSRDVSLRSAHSVVAQETVYIVGRDRPHAGNAYVVVHCRSCQAKLGRMYRSTTPELDHLRGCFTFHAEALRSYMLGTSDVKTAEVIGLQKAEPKVELRDPQGALSAIVDDLTSMQGVLLVLDQRIGDSEAVTADFVKRLASFEERFSQVARIVELASFQHRQDLRSSGDKQTQGNYTNITREDEPNRLTSENASRDIPSKSEPGGTSTTIAAREARRPSLNQGSKRNLVSVQDPQAPMIPTNGLTPSVSLKRGDEPEGATIQGCRDQVVSVDHERARPQREPASQTEEETEAADFEGVQQKDPTSSARRDWNNSSHPDSSSPPCSMRQQRLRRKKRPFECT